MDKRTYNKSIRIMVDILMTVLLLFLMAYQVTGGKYHEWIGAAMLLLFVIHNILNIRWYSKLFKGKYTASRILRTVVNLATFVAIVLTGYSGIVMSRYLFSWLTAGGGMMLARQLHMSCSYWAFVLMSVHLGLHWSMITNRFKGSNVYLKWIARIIAGAIAVYGAYIFGSTQVYSYMFGRVQFAMLDYASPSVVVIMNNICMMVMWCFAGYYFNKGLVGIKKDTRKALADIIVTLIIVIISIVTANINTQENSWGGTSGTGSWGNAGDSMNFTDNNIYNSVSDNANSSADNKDTANINDGFVYIEGGTYMMGSPDTENWRSQDETQHEVTVSSFYISPYELTQKEYNEVMGSNDSMFTGDNLPVEMVSWIEAVEYCNKRSELDGLTPVYSINGENVSWNRAANGYRLPTEAEWEYACRAGTVTPFNTENSISSDEADYYGYYPYDIEENYFSQENLETKPGQYRQTTVAVDSFQPNKWGLYNMHGNVGEWVWDYYGEYDMSNNVNPSGADSGTLRIYRGGGWNDFAKNIRSAYRGTAGQNVKQFNVGIRLVRNAVADLTDIVGVTDTSNMTGTDNASGQTDNSGKTLIVYYSWSGNTRLIANEIQSQTGADIFEITLKNPYSTNYNTVLEQSQYDQSIQARPEIDKKIENIEEYTCIILGYPNWWASIPMPVATFLESYDLSGKTIIPFCSHGGGRFGQSLTAIAKLAPNSTMGQALSVHYSGGSTMKQDVTDWLKVNKVIE